MKKLLIIKILILLFLPGILGAAVNLSVTNNSASPSPAGTGNGYYNLYNEIKYTVNIGWSDTDLKTGDIITFTVGSSYFTSPAVTLAPGSIFGDFSSSTSGGITTVTLKVTAADPVQAGAESLIITGSPYGYAIPGSPGTNHQLNIPVSTTITHNGNNLVPPINSKIDFIDNSTPYPNAFKYPLDGTSAEAGIVSGNLVSPKPSGSEDVFLIKDMNKVRYSIELNHLDKYAGDVVTLVDKWDPDLAWPETIAGKGTVYFKLFKIQQAVGGDYGTDITNDASYAFSAVQPTNASTDQVIFTFNAKSGEAYRIDYNLIVENQKPGAYKNEVTITGSISGYSDISTRYSIIDALNVYGISLQKLASQYKGLIPPRTTPTPIPGGTLDFTLRFYIKTPDMSNDMFLVTDNFTDQRLDILGVTLPAGFSASWSQPLGTIPAGGNKLTIKATSIITEAKYYDFVVHTQANSNTAGGLTVTDPIENTAKLLDIYNSNTVKVFFKVPSKSTIVNPPIRSRLF